MMLHRHFQQMKNVQESEPEPKQKPVMRPKKRRKRRSAFKKAAVFIGTRKVYGDMVTAVKSLFANSDVDKAFFLIEDDEFPYPIPDEVEIMNMSGQEYISKSSPNYNSHFTYLCVLRAAFGRIFEDFDLILNLDDDLVVVDDISDLWEMDLEGNYCAGVEDRGIGRRGYINGGVVLYNLQAMRDDGITDRMIDILNRQYKQYVDQDALNECCGGKVKLLPLRYNESPVTGRTNDPAIVHYVGTNKTGGSNFQYRHYWNEYAALSWDNVAALRKERYGKGLSI